MKRMHAVGNTKPTFKKALKRKRRKAPVLLDRDPNAGRQFNAVS